MRTLAFVLIGFALGGLTLDAQGRGNNRPPAGIPPGQMPAPGQCRVWYDGVPPGRQPSATDCRTAERIAARDRNARVIYGTDYGWSGQRNPRAIPRTQPGNGRYGDWGGRFYDVAFDTGYRDGVEKGREDVRDRDVYDPARHGRYRSADHGYNRNYGSKDEYKGRYRQGFIEGYEAGYGPSAGRFDRRAGF
jgi:hypothetical protein